MNLKNKKYFYFSILGLFLVIGVSYAFIFFRERFEGNNLGLITELLDVKISENGVVSMNNATGQKDEEGIENERTTFNIINNNKVPIRVVIKLVEDDNSNMDINQVRFGILVSGKIMNVGNLGENDGVLLDFQMNPGQDATLESTIWLDYFYNGGTNTEIFSGKYVVEASNVDDYGYMYLKNLVGKNKGLVAINTDGELAQEGDEIREYRYSGSSKYCTYTVDGTEYQLEVDGDTCPNSCYLTTTILREDNIMIGNYDGCSSQGGIEITPNQTTPLDGEVDNYIWFNNEMWRIIGVFKETTGKGKNQELIKIIRDEPLLKEEVPSTYTYNDKEMVIENVTNSGDLKYANVYWNYDNYFGQINSNDWSNSALQYYLNDEKSGANSYYNSIEKEYRQMIETINYNISNAVYDTNTISSYNEERSGNVYSGNQTKWQGRIGMIYPSDYGYAADSGNWNVSMRIYGEVSNTGAFNNWMNDNISKAELTMSPSSYSLGYVMFKYAMGSVYTQYTNGEEQTVSPVLYLKSDVLITAGNGSEEKPYQVERPELVRIPTKATNTIKSKVGTDGLVAINTNGELAGDNDTIREYRYSGSSKYCTYTVDGEDYRLEVDTEMCPEACYALNSIFRNDNDVIDFYGSCADQGGTVLAPNQTKPSDGEVDNYIWFNNGMWRIIGVFKETTGSGKNEELIKIVRDEPLLQDEVPQTYIYDGKEMVIKDTAESDTLKYAYVKWNYENYFGQTNQNDWTKAGLQYYLNDETNGSDSYYNNIKTTYQKMIATVEYDISNTMYKTNAIMSYNNERSGDVWDGNHATWFGKIGLIYSSDYGYATDSSNWKINMYDYGHLTNTGAFNNWMNDSISGGEWGISPSSDYNYGVMGKFSRGYAHDYKASFHINASPVLYLKSDVLITAGNGSEEDPYIVERYEVKKKPTKVVDEIKSKVGTDGIVAINTNGELAGKNDTIREYRYSGSNVNNYVYFNDEMWRAIGLFKNNEGNWNLKLMRNTQLEASELVPTYTIDGTTYYIQSQNSYVYWNSNNTNDWTKAGLQYFLNTEEDSNGVKGYYSTINDSSKKLIDDDYKYYLGNVGHDTVTAITSYDDEHGTDITEGNYESWNGAVGLLYPSDFGYSSDSTYWNNTALLNYNNGAYSSNWMYQTANSELGEWLISPSKYINGDIKYATTLVGGKQTFTNYVNSQVNFYAARPVVNLKSDVLITAGTGSEKDPYRLG